MSVKYLSFNIFMFTLAKHELSVATWSENQLNNDFNRHFPLEQRKATNVVSSLVDLNLKELKWR